MNVAWDSRALQYYGRWDTPTLQAIHDRCSNGNVEKDAELVENRAIIEDQISSICRVVQAMDQLCEAKNTCLADKKEQETEATRLNDEVPNK